MPRDARGRIIRKPQNKRQAGAGFAPKAQPGSPKFQLYNWVDYPISEMWITDRVKDRGMANIFVVRESISGLNVVAFLIDVWGFGLKDSFVKTGVSRRAFTDHFIAAPITGDHMCLTDLATVQKWVYGSVAWALQWGFKTPTATLQLVRLVPEPEISPSLEDFGKDHKPLLVLQPGNLAKFMPRLSLDDLPARGIDFLVASADTPPEFLGRVDDDVVSP